MQHKERRVLKNTVAPALVKRTLIKMEALERRLIRVETRLCRLANGMRVRVK